MKLKIATLLLVYIAITHTISAQVQ